MHTQPLRYPSCLLWLTYKKLRAVLSFFGRLFQQNRCTWIAVILTSTSVFLGSSCKEQTTQNSSTKSSSPPSELPSLKAQGFNTDYVCEEHWLVDLIVQDLHRIAHLQGSGWKETPVVTTQAPQQYTVTGDTVIEFSLDPSVWSPKPYSCLLYTSPSPRDQRGSRMPSSA